VSVSTVADLVAAPVIRQTVITTQPSTARGSTSYCRLGTAMTPAGTPGEALTSHASSLVLPQDLSAHQKLIRTVNARIQANTAIGNIHLHDRLVGVGDIDPTSTGDKTVNSTALTRYTSGHSVEVWLEVQAVPSTTAIVCSLSSYTNQAGTGSRAGATVTFPTATLGVGNMVGPMPLQSGDTGVRSVETLNVATASGGSTARLILWLVRPLYMCHLIDADWWIERETPFPFAIPHILSDGASIGGYMLGYGGTETVWIKLDLALL